MAQLIYSRITIDGEQLLNGSNYSIKLHQKMAEHHKLTVTCPTESLENLMGNFGDRAKSLIGSKISLALGGGTGFGQLVQEDLKFMGVITDVNINKYDNSDGLFIITAYSPTILLSHGLDSQSYENKTLPDIIKEATTEYPTDLVKFKLNPKFTGSIGYTVQYKEDDFSFIKRLAARYGEWFFYDGEIINFGPPTLGNAELTYGVDLHKFNFGLKTRPQDHNYFAYDSLQATTHKASMQEFNQSTSNPFINHVAEVSRKIYAKKPKSVYNHSLFINGSKELDDVVRLKAASALNTVQFTGKGESTAVQIGEAIKVYGTNTTTKLKEFYGRYIVTEVTHKVNSSGEYENKFKGIPRDIEVPPYYDENAVPICEDQYAIVKDNNDPQGLSRIRVQFPWQKITNQLSPWIRVTTPYAGKGKGMHVLPELDEEVLVGFESSCAEKPVILGTMFHGSAKSGHGGAGNYMKGLQTAGGQRVQMNDKDGSLFIQDNGGNSVMLDGAGNLTTTVSVNNTTNVGQNGFMTVGMNNETQVGMMNTLKVGSVNVIDVGDGNSKLIMNNAGDITLESVNKITLKVGGNKIEISKTGITTTAATGKIETTAESGALTMKSMSDEVTVESSSSKATFKGNSETNLGGGSTTKLTGGTVNINEL